MTGSHVCGYRFLQVIRVKEVREEKVERTQSQTVPSRNNALAIGSSTCLSFRRSQATTPVLRASDGEIKALGTALVVPSKGRCASGLLVVPAPPPDIDDGPQSLS